MSKELDLDKRVRNTTDKANYDRSLLNYSTVIGDSVEISHGKQFLAQNSAVIIQPIYPKSNDSNAELCDYDDEVEELVSCKKIQDNAGNALSPPHEVSPTEVDFATRRSLLRYKCEKCGRECPSKHKLKRHLSTHSEARPFPCKICGRTFKWTEYLQKHMRQQHPLGDKGPVPRITKSSNSAKCKNGDFSAEPKDILLDAGKNKSFPSKAQGHSTFNEPDEDKDSVENEDDKVEEESINSNPEHQNNQLEECGLPLKQSVSVGVDMDAEEMNSGEFDKNLLPESTLSIPPELNDVSFLYDDGSTSDAAGVGCYNAQQVVGVENNDMGLRAYNTDDCVTYQNNSTGSYELSSTSLIEGYQCYTSIPCNSAIGCLGNNESFHLLPQDHNQATNHPYFVSASKCVCMPNDDVTSSSKFSEPILGIPGAMQQSGGGTIFNSSATSTPSIYRDHLNSSSSSTILDECSTTYTSLRDESVAVDRTNLDYQSSNRFFKSYNDLQGGYDELQLNYDSGSLQNSKGYYHSTVYSDVLPFCDNRYKPQNCGFRPTQQINVNVQADDDHIAMDLNGNKCFTSPQLYISDHQSITPFSEAQQANNFHSIENIVISASDNMNVNECDEVENHEQVVDIGTQCELGPETLQALFDEDCEEDQRISCSSINDTDDKLVLKFPCKVMSCKKAYIHRKDVIRHMRIRHGITPKKLEAVVVETPEKPHICGMNYCKRSYFHLKDLKRHQRLCHKVNSGPADIQSIPSILLEDVSPENIVNKTQMRYPCDFPGCLRSYVHKKDLVRHKRLYHKDSSSKPTIPEPVEYTDTDLKQIRQKVKQEIATKEQKIRLDSTGSIISVANSIDEEESVENSNSMDEADCTILLSSSTSLQEGKSDVEIDIDQTMSNDVVSILGALEHHSRQLLGLVSETAVQ